MDNPALITFPVMMADAIGTAVFQKQLDLIARTLIGKGAQTIKARRQGRCRVIDDANRLFRMSDRDAALSQLRKRLR